ncbi:MAG: hypothetical protein K2O57_06415, partial [Acetatifactor sp.]|nr:hypothetical protein [Acetatifactor sp.]
DSNGNIVKITMHTNKPGEPDKPEEPDKPGEPDKPEEPDKPGEPDKPENPDKPTEPDKPEVPVKPWRPIRNDKSDESDGSDEQAETGTSDRPFDFGNPFGAGAAGSVGNAGITGITGIDKKAAEYRTDAKTDQSAEAEQADIFTLLEPEEFTQGETDQEGTESDNSNASEAATIGLFQLLVTLFQIFFVHILQWLIQIV